MLRPMGSAAPELSNPKASISSAGAPRSNTVTTHLVREEVLTVARRYSLDRDKRPVTLTYRTQMCSVSTFLVSYLYLGMVTNVSYLPGMLDVTGKVWLVCVFFFFFF